MLHCEVHPPPCAEMAAWRGTGKAAQSIQESGGHLREGRLGVTCIFMSLRRRDPCLLPACAAILNLSSILCLPLMHAHVNVHLLKQSVVK